MTLCKSGLHPKLGPGRCRECKRAKDRRWITSEKGREQRRRAQAKYEAETQTGLQYNLKLLKHRRYKALKARERRRSGTVSEQG